MATNPRPRHEGPHISVEQIPACDVTDDSCIKPFESPFLPGISVRHSPSCSGNFCGLFQCDGGNWRVMASGTLDRSRWIEGWIITQLLTRGYVDCDEHPLGTKAGGWWADAFRPSDQGIHSGFRSGSKLWALQFKHGGATNDLLLQAQDYAYQALDFLVGWGIVTRLDIKAIYVTRAIGGARVPGAIMHLNVHIFGPGVTSSFTLEGSQMPNSEWLWREYMPPRANRAVAGRWYGKVA